MTETAIHYLIESILNIAQLAVGVGVGVWFLQRRGNRPEADLRRARELTMQLHELTTFVTSSVEQHSEQFSLIDAQLQSEESLSDHPVTELVIGVVSEMVRANRELSTKLFQAQQQLEEKTAEIESHITDAMTDPLTELPNRRALDEQLASRIDAWRKHKLPFSLLLLDVDHFKQFNDTHGHQLGDAVLKVMGEALRLALRRHDFVARFGGEEFAVLLPYTTLDDAMCAVRKALIAISEATLEHDGQTLHITASGGLATVLLREGAESLVGRADEALYSAKEAGRNCAYAHLGTRCMAIPAEAELSFESLPKTDAVLDSNREPISEQLLAVCAELREQVARLSSTGSKDAPSKAPAKR